VQAQRVSRLVRLLECPLRLGSLAGSPKELAWSTALLLLVGKRVVLAELDSVHEPWGMGGTKEA